MTGLALQRAVYKILDCFVPGAQALDLDLKKLPISKYTLTTL